VLGVGQLQQSGVIAADSLELAPCPQHNDAQLLRKRGERKLTGEAES